MAVDEIAMLGGSSQRFSVKQRRAEAGKRMGLT